MGCTTPEFSRLGVPVSIYSGASDLVNSLITGLLNECQIRPSQLSELANFTISSPQKSLETGGYVQIQGNLELNTTSIANDTVSLYLNGTAFATTKTNRNGSFSINSSTPFAYEPIAAIWAVASQVQSFGFHGAVSNTLYIQIIFNKTQIVIGDPPAVLPTFSFTVSGQLSTTSGTPLPNAPVRIASFGASYVVRTNASGVFADY